MIQSNQKKKVPVFTKQRQIEDDKSRWTVSHDSLLCRCLVIDSPSLGPLTVRCGLRKVRLRKWATSLAASWAVNSPQLCGIFQKAPALRPLLRRPKPCPYLQPFSYLSKQVFLLRPLTTASVFKLLACSVVPGRPHISPLQQHPPPPLDFPAEYHVASPSCTTQGSYAIKNMLCRGRSQLNWQWGDSNWKLNGRGGSWLVNYSKHKTAE